MKEDIYILGIESSCDETAAAVVKNGREVLSNVIASQVPVHRKFGGVVPEIASRQHIQAVLPVIRQALDEAKVAQKELTAVAVTYGPGLVGALLVGLSAAKALAFALDRPLIGVNHLEGHVFANFLAEPELEPPFLALVVSGGHTSLLKVTDYNAFSLLGETRDDAAGEAFDKVARYLGLPYPGGPEIEKLAQKGDPSALAFPIARLASPYDFSFSGLKSAVINYVHSQVQAGRPVVKADVAASFQKTIIAALVNKTIAAARAEGLTQIALAGGVAANKMLQKTLSEAAAAAGARLIHPAPILCTDNAVMIASRGYYLYKAGIRSPLSLNAAPALGLGG